MTIQTAAKRLKSITSPADMAVRAAGILIARCTIGVLAPFGIAFMGLEKRASFKSAVTLLMVCIGYLTLGNLQVSFKYIAGCVIYQIVLLAVDKEENLKLWFRGAVISAALLFCGTIDVFLFGGSSSGMILVLADAAAAFALVVVMEKGLELLRMGNIYVGPFELVLGDGNKCAQAKLDNLRMRLRRTGDSFRSLSGVFSDLSDKPSRVEMDDIALMFDTVADRVCLNCPKVGECWKQDFNVTYKIMFKFLEIMERRGRLERTEAAKRFDGRCINEESMVLELNKQFEVYRVNRTWKRKTAESRELFGQQFLGMSGIIDGIVKEIDEPGTGAFEEAEFDVEYGMAGRGLFEECGDTHALSHIGNHEFAATLSDGMGTGHRAARESGAIVALLDEFLTAGFDKTTAVKLVNSLMVMKSEHDTFATVDLCVLDLVSGEVEFIKNGAEPSFIKHANHVETVRAASLPVGVISAVEIEQFARTLSDGEFIIMTSDGITAHEADGSGMIRGIIENAPSNVTAQALADIIFESAIEQKSAEADDDVTVIVLKLSQK